MRVIFAGTPEFAVQALDALAGSLHPVVLALTRPDQPTGRGMKSLPSPVKRRATSLGIPVRQPPTLNSSDEQQALTRAGADVMVVAAYGLILPQAVLDIPARGAVNIHASLLPRWRGAAPVQRALLAGDSRTGVTIMQMDAGLDTGPALLCEPEEIAPDDTAGSLSSRLAALGARLVVEALNRMEQGGLRAVPQDQGAATYARKLDKSEAVIDWKATAARVDRQVRAFNPAPGASCRLADMELKIWLAEPLAGPAGLPGTIIAADEAGIVVACGEGALRVRELQRAGGRRLGAAQFLRGTRLTAGLRFTA
ncbi:MAG: methionyl-tRNA formyltransferase [Burkholderiales bacterium]|nr:methionyl-tRNA formyltransferase [Burkholderiales bacterium]